MIKRIARKAKLYFKKQQLKKEGVVLKKGCVLSMKTQICGPANISFDVNIRDSLIDHHSYISKASFFPNTKIGSFTSIGRYSAVAFGNHPLSPFVSFSPVFYSAKRQTNDCFVDKEYFDNYLTVDKEHDIICEIGHDCWIGDNVTIINGCKIGDGALVAAGAVVTKNVEPYSVVAGVPAKHIKYRFTPEQIEFLLKIQWWNWDREQLKENALLFHDIDRFMETFKNKV